MFFFPTGSKSCFLLRAPLLCYFCWLSINFSCSMDLYPHFDCSLLCAQDGERLSAERGGIILLWYEQCRPCVFNENSMVLRWLW